MEILALTKTSISSITYFRTVSPSGRAEDRATHLCEPRIYDSQVVVMECRAVLRICQLRLQQALLPLVFSHLSEDSFFLISLQMCMRLVDVVAVSECFLSRSIQDEDGAKPYLDVSRPSRLVAV